jgi:peptidyl-prolyl cis-trans isomerase D
MALIGKIRKNFWLVLVLLAMALASFILMDVMGSKSGGSMFGGRPTNIGTVAGQKIDYVDFDKTERALYSGSKDVYGRRQMLWNYLTEKAIVEKQSEKLGLGVCRDELMELQFGQRLSPIIQNNFGDQRTGQVNRQQLASFKQAFEANQDMNPEFRSFWKEQENQIIKTAVQDKINAILSKGMIVPKWQAEVVNSLNNDKVNFEFVKVGFDKIPDTELKLTDEDYKTFLAKNPLKYTVNEETRLIDFATFNVVPSLADSNNLKNSLFAMRSEFRNATNDSLFAATKGGGVNAGYAKLSDVTGILKDSLPRMNVGSVVGPFNENGSYVLAKLVDKRVLPDSVKARHILKSASDPAGIVKARRSIDSLRNLITSGRARFDSTAIRNSEDTGSGMKGGDLGTFAQGTMVKPFNDACFLTGKPGGIYTVESQFGVHLIEVLNQKFVDKTPKYLVAIVPTAIVPSQETQDASFDKFSKILSGVKTLDDLKKASEKNPEIAIQSTRGLKANDFNIPALASSETSRGIIKWAFENDLNEVSPELYNIRDEVNGYNKQYVIAGLKAISKPGVMSVAEAKTTLEMQVKNAVKGERLRAKITSTDLNAIATQFGTNRDTASATFANGFIDAIQASEPLVVAKAFAMAKGATSKPIVGNTGVYVVKMVDMIPAVKENSNLDMIKTSIASSAKQSAGYRVWEALKKKYMPEDNRSKFF